MSGHHFVRDYERHVARLKAGRPVEEAMSLAVGGGDFEAWGNLLVDVCSHFGLKDGMQVVDFGCGSGRLAAALGKRMDVQYAGIDVVPDLLEHAKSLSPAHYRFLCHRKLFFPANPGTADFITAFSVFTHLHAPECYIYLIGMGRALKPGGRIVFSYLDLDEPEHWQVFLSTAVQLQKGTLPHLNAFIPRHWIDLWAERIGLIPEAYVGGQEAPWGGPPLGQAVAVLRKPLD